MDIIKVLLLGKAGEDRNKTEEMLLNIEYITLSAIADTWEEAAGILENHTFDVILIDSDTEGNVYDISDKLSEEFPESAIIILADNLQEETIHKAFFAGVKDILIKPVSPVELVDSIYKASRQLKKKLSFHKETIIKSKKKNGRGQVFTVFSTKGGVGKTFVAMNLAVSLAKDKDKKVVLVDLDLDFGNVALILNIIPRFTISDIVDDIRNIDQSVIESYLTPHQSGLLVLPSNARPMMNEFINGEHIELIFRALQDTFDYIVVDMPSRFHNTINPAFTISDQLLMVVTPEVSAIRNVKAALITLNELNYPKSKIRIILNKAGENEIKIKDVESTLNFNLLASLNDDSRHAASTMNLGIPYVLKYPHSKLTKDFNNLVKKLVNPS